MSDYLQPIVEYPVVAILGASVRNTSAISGGVNQRLRNTNRFVGRSKGI